MFYFRILLCLICLHVAGKDWMEHLSLLFQACKCNVQLFGVVSSCNNHVILNVAGFGAQCKNIILGEGKLKKTQTKTYQTTNKPSKKQNNTVSTVNFAYLSSQLSPSNKNTC